MKKVYILAFLCLVSVASARAQYHITGDTVQNYDSTWWVPEWYKVWLDPANMPPKTIWGLTGSWGGFAGEFLIRHVAERPIRVIGIAVCATTYQMGVPGEMGDTMTSAQEYLLIYRSRDKGGGGAVAGKAMGSHGSTPVRFRNQAHFHQLVRHSNIRIHKHKTDV